MKYVCIECFNLVAGVSIPLENDMPYFKCEGCGGVIQCQLCTLHPAQCRLEAMNGPEPQTREEMLTLLDEEKVKGEVVKFDTKK